jgi:hypothetical protein
MVRGSSCCSGTPKRIRAVLARCGESGLLTSLLPWRRAERLFTLATGLVDAARVLSLGHVFTDNMTGDAGSPPTSHWSEARTPAMHTAHLVLLMLVAP